MKKIKYYPVGNGDTSLVKTPKMSIITDCKIRDGEEDIYDVKKDLLKELTTRDGKPFTDLFILTHHDQDHCLNFGKHFHTGSPAQYKAEDEKIIIDELWVNEYILSDDSISEDCDASVIRQEVIRRRNLFKNGDSRGNDRGNRLVLIGYDDNNNFQNVPNYIPGEICKELNGVALGDLEIFIHAPFKKDIVKCNAIGDRNMASIVYQLRFLNGAGDYEARILHGGDADHYRWAEIKKQTEFYNNEEALKWDIFQTPHHCSWTFFNDTPYKDSEKGIDNSAPKETSLSVLDYQLKGAKIVATSKVVKDDDNNPPHYAAKEEYVKKIGEGHFINTDKHYEDKKDPVVFIIENGGLTFLRNAAPIAISSGMSKPSRAGA